MKKLIALSLLVAFGTSAQSNPGTVGAQAVQQSSQRLDACSGVATGSGTAQQTLTITPPPGNYVYFCWIEVIQTATTAPALTALTHTTTNLGSPTSLKLFDLFPAATGVVKTLFYPGNGLLKSTVAGTAVTIVSNAAVTNITYNVTAGYYFAP
jgi:hypothetical protein